MSLKSWRSLELACVAIALCIAAIGARDYAQSWNDGSRLATAESLVDRGTFAIDDSIFVRVPTGGPFPYPPDEPGLRAHGTLDKMQIGGRFYSDKSPVPNVLLAAVYGLLRWTTGLDARKQPDRFCWWLAFATAGFPYVLAVVGVLRTARTLGLKPAFALLLTGSFALSTVALTYSRHVNQHILLLAACVWLQFCFVAGFENREGRRRLLLAGAMAGSAHAIDPGVGPVVLASTAVLALYRLYGRWTDLALFALAALPFVVAHHALNYAIGGTLKPANMVPEHFRWPGSPFSPSQLTGLAQHRTWPALLRYAVSLLIGERGFLFHNPTLLLAIPAVFLSLERRTRELPEVVHAAAWSVVVWLLYSFLSNNHSGVCASIRWFVPILAPAYLLLGIFLRDAPERFGELLMLTLWGAVLAALLWWEGPWLKRTVPLYWPIVAAAVTSWSVARLLTSFSPSPSLGGGAGGEGGRASLGEGAGGEGGRATSADGAGEQGGRALSREGAGEKGGRA